MEFGEWSCCGQRRVVAAARVKIEAVTALTPVSAWFAALVHSAPTLQITDSRELLLWMVAGALCGSVTSVMFPTEDKTATLKRRLFGSFFGAIGLVMIGFAVSGAEPNGDRLLAAGWAAGAVAWGAIPLLTRDGRALLSKWLKSKVGGGNG